MDLHTAQTSAMPFDLASYPRDLVALLQVARGLEKKVHELLEASVLLVKDGNTQQGENNIYIATNCCCPVTL